jgi:hypothetical protein
LAALVQRGAAPGERFNKRQNGALAVPTRGDSRVASVAPVTLHYRQLIGTRARQVALRSGPFGWATDWLLPE